ncbi:MAG: peptidase T [Ardenticatenales bacterium]|nr:peptidase T [Ardenticatenales bacterium]
MKKDVLERFLRYVQIDTQSNEESTSYPSTAKQMVLLNLLAEELRALGVPNVQQDEYGYVMATLPSTLPPTHPTANRVPTIGFLAHVDTSPEVTGANVRPQVIPAYQGGVITLVGDPSQKIDPAESVELSNSMGHTLVTTDGTTLLGADNKCGVAEIMTAVAYLMAHPEIEHGPIAIGFTPDEEVGRGAEYFDVTKFGATYAYTLDGSVAGEVQFETFSADAVTITFHGRNQHPGYAKDKMVNAIKLASEFLARLPKDHLSPETTSNYEGFVHPYGIEGGVEETRIKMLLRDFSEEKLLEYRIFLQGLAQEIKTLEPRAEITLEFRESYRNMRATLNKVHHVVEYAEEAIRRVGFEPASTPVRGGTDGSRLTAMGLPTPNLFTGAYNYHSLREWASVDTMVKAVETVVELVKLWAERGERES